MISPLSKSRLKISLLGVGFAMFAACTPRRDAPARDDASARERQRDAESVDASAFVARVASVANDASSPIDASVEVNDPRIVAVVAKWNAAHVAHDSAALRGLYAPQLFFYGVTLSNVDAAIRKGAAFAKAKDYAQSVRDLVVKNRGTRAVATFTKTTTTAGASKDVGAVLYVDASDRITAEMDKLASDWCHQNHQLVVPPFTINEAQAEAHLLRAYTFEGHPLKATAGSRPFVQELTCPDPTECASGETRTAPPAEDDRTPACFFLVRAGVSVTTPQLGGNGHQWFDLGSFVDGATNVLWYEDAGENPRTWRRDPKLPSAAL